MKTFHIGRNPDNDIVYNEGLVSGRHAEISVGDDGQIVFTDYSTNGSYVKGTPVKHTSVPVVYGDSIEFPGNIIFDWGMIASYIPQQNPVDFRNFGGNQNGFGGDYNGFDGGHGQVNPTPTTNTLSYPLALREGLDSGLRNAMRMLAIIPLALLTCWVPYINLGVFIALSTLPAQWAKGEPVNPLSIFHPRYRRPMGNFLLTQVLVSLTTTIACVFTVIPGLVILYAWYLALLFVVEYDMNPLEATNASNTCTYGSKWKIFATLITYGALSVVTYSIVSGIYCLLFFSLSDSPAAVIIIGILFVITFIPLTALLASIGVGINGSIWKQLKTRVVA